MALITICLAAIFFSACAEKKPANHPAGIPRPGLGVIEAGAGRRNAANRAVESQDRRLEEARDIMGGGNPTGE